MVVAGLMLREGISMARMMMIRASLSLLLGHDTRGHALMVRDWTSAAPPCRSVRSKTAKVAMQPADLLALRRVFRVVGAEHGLHSHERWISSSSGVVLTRGSAAASLSWLHHLHRTNTGQTL